MYKRRSLAKDLGVPADRLARVYSHDMLGGVRLVITVTVLALCNKQVRSLTTGGGRVATEAPVTPPPEGKAHGRVPEPAPVPATEATSPQNPAG